MTSKQLVLIETYWNVKISDNYIKFAKMLKGINRNILECKGTYLSQ